MPCPVRFGPFVPAYNVAAFEGSVATVWTGAPAAALRSTPRVRSKRIRPAPGNALLSVIPIVQLQQPMFFGVGAANFRTIDRFHRIYVHRGFKMRIPVDKFVYPRRLVFAFGVAAIGL